MGPDGRRAAPTGTGWTGVRNHLAKQQMMAMKKGDLAFFYHSNVGKEIVGIVESHQDLSSRTRPIPAASSAWWTCARSSR